MCNHISIPGLTWSPTLVAPVPQVELATILKFVLDHEESLSENLEVFLQRRGEHGAGSSSAQRLGELPGGMCREEGGGVCPSWDLCFLCTWGFGPKPSPF